MKKIVVLAIAMVFVFGLFYGVSQQAAYAKDYKIGYVDLAKVFDEYKKTKDSEKGLDDLDGGKTAAVACVAYGKNDGMESAQCDGMGKPAGCKTRDGKLWFPTTKGLITVDPQTTPINHVPPPVYIEQRIAERKPVL